jgi:drug/metabolite transporter (DMT)-like permease
LLFSLAAALVKAINGRVPVFEIVLIRSLVAAGISVGVARNQGISPLFGQRSHFPILAGRGVIGAAAMTCFYESILRLPLADCITILFCNPAMTSLLAWLLLGESFGLLTVLGCCASMVGVVMVARPQFIFGGEQRCVGWAVFGKG